MGRKSARVPCGARRRAGGARASRSVADSRQSGATNWEEKRSSAPRSAAGCTSKWKHVSSASV